ncbi:hypothetical protein [Natronosalvus caseinilyticus]|nr:hypothetical protein [Natronosalvus caseinilyticus]
MATQEEIVVGRAIEFAHAALTGVTVDDTGALKPRARSSKVALGILK